jgi:hypothetical protein
MEGKLASDRRSGRVARQRLGKGAEVAVGVVVESSHSFVGAEVVIERPVLLHEKDHVLDRSEV